MDSNTESVAEPARSGPRTPVVLTAQKMFLIRLSSKSGLGSPITVIDKIWIKPITLPAPALSLPLCVPPIHTSCPFRKFSRLWLRVESKDG